MRKNRCMIAITLLCGLALGCANEDRDTVVHDTIDDLSRGGAFEFDLSHINSNLAASRVVIGEPMAITECAWTGVLDTLHSGADGIVDNRSNFQIIVYDASGSASGLDEAIFSTTVSASCRALSGNLSAIPQLSAFVPHRFSWHDSPIVELEAGEYWFVVANSGSGSWFHWAVEDGHVGVGSGSGGLVYNSLSGAWESPVPGTEPAEARGYSLMVKGRRAVQ